MITPARYSAASAGGIQRREELGEEQPAEQRHRERLHQPVHEERDEEARWAAADAPDRREVDLQHHRVDHQPDQHGDRDVDLAAPAQLHGAQPLHEGREELARSRSRAPCRPPPTGSGSARTPTSSAGSPLSSRIVTPSWPREPRFCDCIAGSVQPRSPPTSASIAGCSRASEGASRRSATWRLTAGVSVLPTVATRAAGGRTLRSVGFPVEAQVAQVVVVEHGRKARLGRPGMPRGGKPLRRDEQLSSSPGGSGGGEASRRTLSSGHDERIETTGDGGVTAPKPCRDTPLRDRSNRQYAARFNAAFTAASYRPSSPPHRFARVNGQACTSSRRIV